MIAVIAVLLALLGIFGTWPLLTGSFWGEMTGYSYVAGIESELNARIGAYGAPDGWLLILIAFILLIMMFMITTPVLMRIRRVIIGTTWLFYFLEFFATLGAPIPFKGFAGLFYTFVMLSIAFVLAFTQWGSKSALVSSLQGQPTSEFDIASQTVTQIFKDAAQVFKWKVRTRGEGAQVEKEREFTGKTLLKVGRDPNWADFVIDRENKYVSRRHASFASQPNGIVVRFEDAKYSMNVNGQLHKPSERMFLENQFYLEVELVAEYGPHLTIQATPFRRSMVHPKTMASVSGQLFNRYKSARLQIKAALMLILFAVVGMGNLSMMATSSVEALYKIKAQQLKEAKTKIHQVQKELKKKLADLQNLQKRIESLQNEYLAAKQKLEETSGRNQQLQQKVDSLQQALKEVAENMRNLDAESIHAIEEQIRTYQDYVLGKSVFLGILLLQNGANSGTVWIGKYNQNYYFITADHVIYPEDHGNEQEIDPTNYIVLCKRYREGIPDTTNLSDEDLIKIDRRLFNRFRDIDIAVLKIDQSIGEYANFALPIDPTLADKIINEGNLVSWFGFPKGHYASGTVGFCTEIVDGCIVCNSPTYHGASGGPLFKIDNEGAIMAFAVVSGLGISEQLTNRFALLQEYMLR